MMVSAVAVTRPPKLSPLTGRDRHGTQWPVATVRTLKYHTVITFFWIVSVLSMWTGYSLPTAKPRLTRNASVTTTATSTFAAAEISSPPMSDAYPSLQSGYTRRVVLAGHPDYTAIQNDLAIAGQILTELVAIENERLKDKFNVEKDHMLRAKSSGS